MTDFTITESDPVTVVSAPTQGPQGIQGIQGIQGVIGNDSWGIPTTWAVGGNYSSLSPKSVVNNNGSSYLCLLSHIAGASFSADLASGKWVIISSKGDQGIQGIQGPAGDITTITTEVNRATARGTLYAAPFDAMAYNGIQSNGAMEVSNDIGTTALTFNADNNYTTLDNWRVVRTGTMIGAVQQVVDSPPGFTTSLKVTISTAQSSLGTSDTLYVYQPIEGTRFARLSFGNSNALAFTIGFWTKIHRTGTYSGSAKNAAQDRSYPFTFTQSIADTWEYKTVTIQPDTTGTWISNTTAVAAFVIFAVAAGTAVVSTANAWTAGSFNGVTATTNGVAATSDVFQITGVTIHPGTEAPSSIHSPLIARPYFEEERLAARYYWKIPAGFFFGNGTLRTGGLAGYPSMLVTPMQMRANPTVGFTGAQIIAGDTLVNLSTFTASISAGGCAALQIAITWSGSVGNIGDGFVLFAATNPVIFDARI